MENEHWSLWMCAGSLFKATNKKITVRTRLPTAGLLSSNKEKHPEQGFTTTAPRPAKKLSYWKSKQSKFKGRCCSNFGKQESLHQLCVQPYDLIGHRKDSKQWKTNCSKPGTSYRPSRWNTLSLPARVQKRSAELACKQVPSIQAKWNLSTKANTSP